MAARQKLNASYGTGSLLVAAVLGGLAGSWPAFVVALAALLALNLYAGEIRPGRGDRREGRSRHPHSRKEERHEKA